MQERHTYTVKAHTSWDEEDNIGSGRQGQGQSEEEDDESKEKRCKYRLSIPGAENSALAFARFPQ